MTGTLEALAAAATFFVASHLVLSAGAVRTGLVRALGAVGFRALYSLVALAAMVWLVRAYGAAPEVVLWQPGALRALPLVVMPFAAILAVCGLTTRGPTAIGGEVAMPPGADPTPGIYKITRHPFLWAVALWALAHIGATGDAASLLLFGAFATLAFAGMAHIDHRRRESMGAAWGPVALTTSVLPFAAIVAGRARLSLAEIGTWRVLAGVALYLALLVGHQPVIGVSPLP